MTATLTYKRGTEEREIACTALLTIGRTPPNEIVIPHPKVSRNHAIIRMLKPGEHYLIDVGSTNGTYLNGRRIVIPTLLNDLDVITLEDCSLTFHAPPPPPISGEHEEDGPMTVTMTSVGIEVEEVTFLVCDIRNYTPLSESLAPSSLAALMARWFKSATQAIAEGFGTVDKFIGDAVMVRWKPDAGKDAAWPVLCALRVAKRLSDICAEVNRTVPGLPCPFRIGVGINTGRAVLGTLGGSGYREYTAIGDAVNMAFRFESESKALGKDVVVGPDSYKHLPRRAWERACRDVTVKGKNEPVSVWAIAFDEIDAILAGGE